MDTRTPDQERFGGLMQARRRPTRRTLVQDVLLSLHGARASYGPGRPSLPWLLAIVRNQLADGARSHARGAAHEVRVEDLDVTFAEVPANTLAEIEGDMAAMRDAIRALPAGQRDAIEMLTLRERSLKEAAAAQAE